MSDQVDINNNTNTIKNEVKPKKNFIDWKSIFSGSILQSNYVYKQRWYILFLFFLSVVYISNRYKADKTLRYSLRLQNEVADKKAEYISKSSELMRLSKRSQVIRLIERRNIDLKESKMPPKRVTSK